MGYIFVSSLALSFIILVPLGAKWEIEKKISIPSAIFIGILSSLVVNGIKDIGDLKFYQVLVLEIAVIVGIAVSVLLWRFYRDPERKPPDDQNSIVSPADGRIIYIKNIEDGKIAFSEKKGHKIPLNDFVQSDVLPLGGYLIGISMNYLDVHVNRAPVGGRITRLQHVKGEFLSLKRKEAVFQNERMFILIDNGLLKVGIVQIASRLVRKIVFYLREGHEVKKGQKIGAIRFGSQVDLILPNLPPIKIEVALGERVKAGVSVVGRIVDDQNKGRL